MNRISIVGLSGSGKSTLANRLGKKLDLPVFHLDKYFWTANWQRKYPIKADFNKVVQGLMAEEKWIIDGIYKGTLDVRLERSDIIIFLDFPKWRCLWRVFVRVFNSKQPYDKTEGIKEKLDLDFVIWIIKYKTGVLREKVLAHRDNKKIYIAKNNKEIDKVFEDCIGSKYF